ncbi:MAG: transglycosylase SLT domain-containing protein [Pseudomonadota bacterium]
MSTPTSSPIASQLGLPQAALSAAASEARTAINAQPARAAATRQVTSAPPISVEQAIANAARSTSVAFDYLVAQAQVESGMNPQARARTSSASGLYQFIESTWLDTVKRHGARFGLGDIADQIQVTRNGAAYVTDPAQRSAILALREDPEIASLMAAGLAEDNRAHLMPILGRQPAAGELYLAHFLGAGGAGRFLSALQADPAQSAASLFRRPAAANRAVFFEAGGQPRSLAGVMNFLDAKMDRAMASAPSIASDSGSGDTFGFSRRVANFATRYPSGRDAGVPYLITSEDVFGPAQPPQISGGSAIAAPRIPASSTLSLPGAPLPPLAAPTTRSRSMSGLLGSSFTTSGASDLASPDATQRIRQAYERLRAMGL